MAPNVHLIGHSLGAQLAAEAGAGGQVGRITGRGPQGDVGWGEEMGGGRGRVTQPAGAGRLLLLSPLSSSGGTDTEQHQH